VVDKIAAGMIPQGYMDFGKTSWPKPLSQNVFSKIIKGILSGGCQRGQAVPFPVPIPADKVALRLAGGILGVTAAMDEVVGKYSDLTLWIALGLVFLCCVIPHRSFLRGFVLLASLVAANYVALVFKTLKRVRREL